MEQIVNYGFWVIVTLAIVWGLWSTRRSRKAAKAFAETMSEAEKKRLAYDTYLELNQPRNLKWWHWLLILTFLSVALGPFWWQMMHARYDEELGFDSGALWIMLVVIPHLWIYPLFLVYVFVRTSVDRRVARLMKSAVKMSAIEPMTPGSENPAPGTDALPYELELIFEFSHAPLDKQKISNACNVFGKAPTSFLYLYDFYTRNLPLKYSFKHSLSECGPVFYMETPQQVSLLHSLQLLNPEVFASQVATSHEWVERFFLDADRGAQHHSRRNMPFGRYPVHRFIAMDTIWQDAVLLLSELADFVVLDVMSFNGKTPGLSWEIESAAEHVASDRLIILAGPYTYMPELERHLKNGWCRRSASLESGPLKVLRFACDPESIRNREQEKGDVQRNYVIQADDLVRAGVLP